jgi:hypothetical protein
MPTYYVCFERDLQYASEIDAQTESEAAETFIAQEDASESRFSESERVFVSTSPDGPAREYEVSGDLMPFYQAYLVA